MLRSKLLPVSVTVEPPTYSPRIAYPGPCWRPSACRQTLVPLMRSTMTIAVGMDCGYVNWMVTVGARTRASSGHPSGRASAAFGTGDVETTLKVPAGTVGGTVGDSLDEQATSPRASRVVYRM